MKILYIYRYLLLGGVCTQLSNRLVHLSKKCEVHLAFLRDHGGETAFRKHPHVYKPKTDDELKDLINKNNYDLIINVDTEEAYEVIHASSFQGKVIHEVHGTSKRIEYLKWLDVSTIDALITPTQYVMEVLRKEYNVSTSIPAYVTPNCLELEHFYPRSVSAGGQPRVMLWIGKINDHKNWRGFIELAADYTETYPDSEIWLAGGETASPRPVKELLSYVEEHKLMNKWRWLPRVEYEAMPHLYSFVAKTGGFTMSTSTNESFGMTLIEALACECPVIAPNVGGIPEVLQGSLQRAMYQGNDLQGALSLAGKMSGDQQWRKDLAKEGREEVASRYGVEPVVDHYFSTLQTIVNQ